MKKLFTLALSLSVLSVATLHASDFTVLNTPEAVLANSSEDVAGAKASFESVLSSSTSTEADITAAMQSYVLTATPNPGYAFDLSFMLQYNAINADNQGKYTNTNLATVWHTDVEGVTIASDSKALQKDATDSNGIGMRIYDASLFKTANEAAFGKFLVYQTVELGKGKYELQAQCYAKGAAGCATLSAGENNSATAIAGAPYKAYSVNFDVASTEDVKVGLKRNDKAGSLTHVYFNDMYLYKLSDLIAITDNATEGLTPAEGVNIQLQRDFETDKYYAVTLPFIVENWRDVFEDCLAWTNYTEETGFTFNTVASANTLARKPYLIKVKENITADNYLNFYNVTVTKGNGGTWNKGDEFPVLMQGNWAAGTVPANAYYLDGEEWKLSDGSAPLTAFSAYMSANFETYPETIAMNVKSTTGVETMVDAIESNPETLVNVYNIQGMVIRRGVAAADALEGLASGIYIVNGKKFVK